MKKEPIIGAYKVTVIGTKRFYIGSSKDVYQRFSYHANCLRNGKHHCKNFQREWNPDIVLKLDIFPTKTREEAYQKEQELLDQYQGSPLLLNIGKSVFGGDNLTNHPDREKIVDKMTKSVRKRYSEMTPEEIHRRHSKPGEKNGMWGRTHTPEVRKKLSLKMKTPEGQAIVRKMVEGGVRWIRSPEGRKFLSEMASKRIGPKNSFYGKTHTPETREKLRKMFTGRDNPSCWRPVVVFGEYYDSLSKASKATGKSSALLNYYLRKEKHVDCYYPTKSLTTIETTETGTIIQEGSRVEDQCPRKDGSLPGSVESDIV